MAEPMTLQIITPDAIVFEGKSTFFVGKAIDGAFWYFAKPCTYDYRIRLGTFTHRSTRWNIS